MRAAKTSHVPPTTARRDTRRIALPIEVDSDSGRCPIVVRRPRATVPIHWRSFANQKRFTRAVGDFLDLHPAAVVRISPKDTEAIGAVMAIHFPT